MYRVNRVKDFNQLYLQLWRDASMNEINLPVDSREQAVNFRQHLHLLRKAMKSEAHPFSDAAQRVKIKIEFQQQPPMAKEAENDMPWLTYTNNRAAEKAGISLRSTRWRLRMIPYDALFDAILERAGYKVARLGTC
jgi:hypothetical protein